jgi:uncharacterized membrane protein YdbT with pleckstrin-like domain
MQFIEKTLLTDEKLLLIARPHWIVYLIPCLAFVLSVLLYIGVFGAGIKTQLVIYGMTPIGWAALCAFLYSVYAFLGAYVTRNFSEYGVTNKRVLMKEGMIQRNSLELFLDKIEAIHVDQSILARILNYGTLVVVGTGGSCDPFRYVPEPLLFRKAIQEQIDHFIHDSK